MHQAALEEWSRRSSYLHSRDARAKLTAMLALLIVIGTTPFGHGFAFAGYFTVLMSAVVLAHLPPAGFLLRLAAVSPVILLFAAASWISGDAERAALILLRGLLSAGAALLLIATTPPNQIFDALERLRLPHVLVSVIQTVYRYLSVLSAEAASMRLAAQSRSGRNGLGSLSQAASALSVLFARSYERAGAIHRAMLARGYSGRTVMLSPAGRFTRDIPFILAAAALPVCIRLGF